MNTRKIDDYWLVWAEGLDWPEQFADETAAKRRAKVLAHNRLGYTVHVCRLNSVGTIMIPHNPNLAGVMVDATE